MTGRSSSNIDQWVLCLPILDEIFGRIERCSVRSAPPGENEQPAALAGV